MGTATAAAALSHHIGSCSAADGEGAAGGKVDADVARAAAAKGAAANPLEIGCSGGADLHRRTAGDLDPDLVGASAEAAGREGDRCSCTTSKCSAADVEADIGVRSNAAEHIDCADCGSADIGSGVDAVVCRGDASASDIFKGEGTGRLRQSGIDCNTDVSISSGAA